MLCLESGNADCSAVVSREVSGSSPGQASWWRISSKRDLVRDESDSIAEAGYWAGRGLEAETDR